MAFGDNENVVVLEVEDSRVREGVKSANTALDSVDAKAASVSKSASRSFAGMGDVVVRTFDRSRSSIERLVATAEKKAASLGASRVERMLSERDSMLGRVKGDPAAVERLNRAYEKLIQHERELERTEGLKKVTEDAKKSEAALTRTVAVIAGMALGLKALIIDTALYAARTETLGVALEAVAKANNVSATALREQERQMKTLGISTQEARTALTQIVAAQLDFSKAAKLARLAQDVAIVGNINSSEALERLTHGIVSQQIEALRTIGIQVNFQSAFERSAKALGKTALQLTETEKKQIAYNEVLAQAPKFAGLYEAAMGTAGKQMGSLRRLIDEAKNAIGEGFLPAVSSVVQTLTNGLVHIRKHAEGYTALAKAATAAAVGLIAMKTTTATLGLFVAAVNPAIGITVGVLTALAAIFLLTQDRLATQRKAVLNHIESLESQREALKKATLTQQEYVSQLRELDQRALAAELSLAKLNNEIERNQRGRTFSAGTGGALFIPNPVLGEADGKKFFAGDTERIPDSAFIKWRKAREEQSRTQEANEKATKAAEHARKMLIDAQKSEMDGMQRLSVERREALKEYGLTRKAIEDINAAFAIRERTELAKLADERQENERILRRAEQERNRALAERLNALPTGQTLAAYEKAFEIARDTADRRADYESRVIAQTRDAQLQALQAQAAEADRHGQNAVAVKIAVEQRKFEIEREYAIKSAAAEADRVDRAAQRQVAQLQRLFETRLITEEAFNAQRDAIVRDAAEQGSQIERDAIATIEKLRGDSYIRSAEIYRTEHERAFESTKRSFESLIDQMFGQTRSWGDAMKGILRAALLQPLKEAAATLFAGAVTGRRGQPGGGLLGGILGGLFGGGIGIPGAPGGTGGFAGPVAGAGSRASLASIPLALGGIGGGFSIPVATGTAGGTAAAQNAGLLAMLKGQGGGALGLLRSLGNLGHTGGWHGSGIGAARGVGGTAGGAMLLGGGILAADGLRRGGMLGLAEATAGGALIGFKFGGPLGAAIGAGVGALAGFVRLFVKGAQEKLRAKIKAVYSIDVADKGLLRSLMDTIKSQFGGNIDVGIRSPQIRDLLELYAMSTGQGDKFPVANRVRPVSFSQTSSGLSMMPSFENGRQLPFAGTLDRAQATGATIGAPVVLRLDGQATTALLRGEAVNVIVGSPRQVATATASGQRASAGRRESQALAWNAPGLVTG